MYDLNTLSYLNEQAHLRHLRTVERAQEESQKHASEEKAAPVYPLANLARLLVTGPPSIAYLVELVENSEVVSAFMELVCQYLPDHEEEIRAVDIDDRIRVFSHYFGSRYFPLSDQVVDEFTLEDFMRQIPVELMGFTYDDFHGFMDFRTGYILLLSLVESPFAEEGGGSRVPIIAHVGDLLGSDIAGQIPADGWTPDQLHKLTDETTFEGVGNFADWIHSQTDCWMLDANYYEYEGETWHPDIVSGLAEQWPRVQEIQDKYHRVAEFIEENPKKHFLELLNILLDVNMNEFVVPDEQLPFPLDNNAQVIST